MYLAPPLSHFDELRVDLEFAHVEAAGGYTLRAVPLAQDLLYPRHQFSRVDRRAHIVVRAELDTHYAIHRVLVPQESHRRNGRALDGADNLKPPFVGQAVIHDRNLKALP